MKQNLYGPTNQAAEAVLNDFAHNWNDKYSYSVKSWMNNWNELTVFYDFPVEIRTIIYTTNLIENLKSKIRMFTKNNLSYPTDQVVMKSVFLATRETPKKWTQPIRNRGHILRQFIAIFEEMVQL